MNLKQPHSQVRFYTLEYDASPLPGLGPLPFVIKVERFSAAPAYDTRQMVYRDGSHTRNAYAYHRWRTDPGDLVSSFLSRDLKGSGLFRAVLSYDSSLASSHLLEGTVDEFLEWNDGGAWQAVLTVTTTLVADAEPDVTGRIVFQKTYRSSKACEGKGPAALAEAMSRAMGEISLQIIKDIYEHLKDASPGSPPG